MTFILRPIPFHSFVCHSLIISAKTLPRVDGARTAMLRDLSSITRMYVTVQDALFGGIGVSCLINDWLQ